MMIPRLMDLLTTLGAAAGITWLSSRWNRVQEMNFGEINLRRAQVLATVVQNSKSKPAQVQDLSLTIRKDHEKCMLPLGLVLTDMEELQSLQIWGGRWADFPPLMQLQHLMFMGDSRITDTHTAYLLTLTKLQTPFWARVATRLMALEEEATTLMSSMQMRMSPVLTCLTCGSCSNCDGFVCVVSSASVVSIARSSLWRQIAMSICNETMRAFLKRFGQGQLTLCTQWHGQAMTCRFRCLIV